MATSCVDGYTLTSGGQCVNLNTDSSNWYVERLENTRRLRPLLTPRSPNSGSIGNVCSVEGAKSQFCLNGKCLASSCESGLSLTASGKCLNLQSDPSNW